jgi:glycolate oxidase FAD binding subunit
MPGTASVARDLAQACPTGTREGTREDAVDGLVPDFVLYPASTAQVSAAMTVAAQHGLSVVVRGAGTKLDWGAPPDRLAFVIDVSRMCRVLEHSSGDWVVRAEAGLSLDALQTALAGARQRLAIDEVVPGSTLGGMVSTAACGPLRYGHGPVRDLLLGVTVVRADGVVARAGSKVVKNVAGYDLAKLFTGAYGTLGVITELIFKLRPVPEAQLFVSAEYPSVADAGTALQAVLRSQVAPAAVEIWRPRAQAGTEICVLVEGRASSVRARAEQLSRSMAGAGTRHQAPEWWGTLPGPVVLKLTAVVSAVSRLVEAIGDICSAHGVPQSDVRGSAGSGVLYIGLPTGTEADQLATLMDQLRQVVSGMHGHVTLLRAPAPTKRGVDIWGPVPGLALMRQVKERFDPDRRLAPGRFVGGI